MTTDNDIEREIQDKGLTAPRVTPESIAAKISSEWYFTAMDGVHHAQATGQLPWRYRGQETDDNDFEDMPEEFRRKADGLDRLTFCVLVLENGFTVTGQSAPASAANFDRDLGRKIARAHAVKKIWPLEGYLLREKLHEAEGR